MQIDLVIENVIGAVKMCVSTGRSPMSGPVSLSSIVEIPPGEAPFLKKVRLHGAFGVDDTNFTKPGTGEMSMR